MEFWNLIPNELKLVLVMAMPVFGKGMVFIPIGMYVFKFSLEKTVFLCSLGSAIKVGYYFLMIYGVEKYLLRRGYFSIKKFENWLEKARSHHRWLYECVGIMALAILPNIGSGVFPCACLAYVCGIKILWGILFTVGGSTVGTYVIALGFFYAKPGLNLGLHYFTGG